MPAGNILVVDDEERQREIYRDILEDEGYDTETARQRRSRASSCSRKPALTWSSPTSI